MPTHDSYSRFVTAFLCLSLFGCTESRSVVGTERYLALGDSYTVGEGVAAHERWPLQLVARLRAHGVAIAEPQIIARTGWTTRNLLAALDTQHPQGPFALISLLIGVNNQYQGRDLDEYRSELGTLLQRAKALAQGNASRVLVLSIPDWGATPFAAGRDRNRITLEIERFNRVCHEETERIGARYIDIASPSRQASGDSPLVTRDGLHPSAQAYAAWVELVLGAALDAIGTPRS